MMRTQGCPFLVAFLGWIILSTFVSASPPTGAPSPLPTSRSSALPTATPTALPTARPSAPPTNLPTKTPAPTASPAETADGVALCDFYNTVTPATNRALLKGWCAKDPVSGQYQPAPCSGWFGITCDEIAGVKRVTSFGLTSRAGTPALGAATLPSSLGGLDALTSMNLWGCGIAGSIPSQIGTLTALTYLGLGANALTGPIPGTFCNLVKSSLWLQDVRKPNKYTCYPSCLSANANFMTYIGAVPACSAPPTTAPTPQPSLSKAPTVPPSPLPSPEPTAVPTTPYPSSPPSVLPSPVPSVRPTAAATALPTLRPSATPTMETKVPTPNPTALPTAPTPRPSAAPSLRPSALPSLSPTVLPTSIPTTSPPSTLPTPLPPTPDPTTLPTLLPTPNPTTSPTDSPTTPPSLLPTPSPSLPLGQTYPPTATPTAPPTATPFYAAITLRLSGIDATKASSRVREALRVGMLAVLGPGTISVGLPSVTAAVADALRAAGAETPRADSSSSSSSSFSSSSSSSLSEGLVAANATSTAVFAVILPALGAPSQQGSTLQTSLSSPANLDFFIGNYLSAASQLGMAPADVPGITVLSILVAPQDASAPATSPTPPPNTAPTPQPSEAAKMSAQSAASAAGAESSTSTIAGAVAAAAAALGICCVVCYYRSQRKSALAAQDRESRLHSDIFTGTDPSRSPNPHLSRAQPKQSVFVGYDNAFARKISAVGMDRASNEVAFNPLSDRLASTRLPFQSAPAPSPLTTGPDASAGHLGGGDEEAFDVVPAADDATARSSDAAALAAPRESQVHNEL